MSDWKIKKFDSDWVGVPVKLEFWEADDDFLPPDHHYKWTRTEGPYPEMFKWEWFEESHLPRRKDEWDLEKLRSEHLERED